MNCAYEILENYFGFGKDEQSEQMSSAWNGGDATASKGANQMVMQKSLGIVQHAADIGEENVVDIADLVDKLAGDVTHIHLHVEASFFLSMIYPKRQLTFGRHTLWSDITYTLTRSFINHILLMLSHHA